MTVIGDDIIKNCRECFSKRGFGIRLVQNGSEDSYICPSCRQEYVIKNGHLYNTK